MKFRCIKRILTHIVCLVLISVLESNGQENSSIRFTVKIEQDSLLNNLSVHLRFFIQNISDTNILIPNPPFFGILHDGATDIVIHIEEKRNGNFEGIKNESMFDRMSGANINYILLQPSDKFTDVENLGFWYKLFNPGTYRVRLLLKGNYNRYIQPVFSNWEEFTITSLPIHPKK